MFSYFTAFFNQTRQDNIKILLRIQLNFHSLMFLPSFNTVMARQKFEKEGFMKLGFN